MQLVPFPSFSRSWGVSISPGQGSGSLSYTFFSPVLHLLLSFPHKEVSALIRKVRPATFLSGPFPFSFPSGSSSILFWLHNQRNYLSDDFLDFPSAWNRHLWALLLINVFENHYVHQPSLITSIFSTLVKAIALNKTQVFWRSNCSKLRFEQRLIAQSRIATNLE